jgi:hypothetical protein
VVPAGQGLHGLALKLFGRERLPLTGHLPLAGAEDKRQPDNQAALQDLATIQGL